MVCTEENHTSVILHATHGKGYIQEEVGFNAIIGPFLEKPCPLHVSPLMVRDKQDSLKKRTFMDLRRPQGQSVNDSVTKDTYLDTDYTLT